MTRQYVKVKGVKEPKNLRKKLLNQMGYGINLKRFQDTSAQQAEKVILPRLAKTGRKHFKGMIKTLRGLLNNPQMGDIYAPPANYRLAVTAANGNNVIANTKPWLAKPKRLSHDYINKPSKSTTFWRKTGTLAGQFELATANALKNPGTIKSSVVPAKSPERVQMDLQMHFGGLPPPLRRLVGKAFVTGKRQSVLRVRGVPKATRLSAWRLNFPEHFRPIVSPIAARLGKELHLDLKQ